MYEFTGLRIFLGPSGAWHGTIFNVTEIPVRVMGRWSVGKVNNLVILGLGVYIGTLNGEW